MKIAVLSDTHGLLREEVKEIIRECEAVIHAGDINSRVLLNEIAGTAGWNTLFYVVRGNNDREWAMDIPLTREFELEGVRFFLVHNRKDIPPMLGDTQVVIFGHSHKYLEEEKEGRLWLNPGSCGKRRFHQPITMAVLEIRDGQWRVEKIDISPETGEVIRTEESKIPEENLLPVIKEIFVRMDKGQTVDLIGMKMGLKKEFVEEICRIRVTHPGVTAEGIMNKIEVNRL